MLSTLLASSLARILIVLSWVYVTLSLNLSLLNFASVLLVLLVIFFPKLSHPWLKIVLVAICPLLFFVNFQADLTTQLVSVVYLGLLFVALKKSKTVPKVAQTAQATSSQPQYQKTQVFDTAQPIQAVTPVINLRQAEEQKMAAAVAAQAKPKPKVKKDRFAPLVARIKTPQVALLLFAIGFFVGIAWDTGTLSGLTYQESPRQYYSYLRPPTDSEEIKQEILSTKATDDYLAPVSSNEENLLNIFTFRTQRLAAGDIESFIEDLAIEAAPPKTQPDGQSTSNDQSDNSTED